VHVTGCAHFAPLVLIETPNAAATVAFQYVMLSQPHTRARSLVVVVGFVVQMPPLVWPHVVTLQYSVAAQSAGTEGRHVLPASTPPDDDVPLDPPDEVVVPLEDVVVPLEDVVVPLDDVVVPLDDDVASPLEAPPLVDDVLAPEAPITS